MDPIRCDVTNRCCPCVCAKGLWRWGRSDSSATGNNKNLMKARAVPFKIYFTFFFISLMMGACVVGASR